MFICSDYKNSQDMVSWDGKTGKIMRRKRNGYHAKFKEQDECQILVAADWLIEVGGLMWPEWAVDAKIWFIENMTERFG